MLYTAQIAIYVEDIDREDGAAMWAAGSHLCTTREEAEREVEAEKAFYKNHLAMATILHGETVEDIERERERLNEHRFFYCPCEG